METRPERSQSGPTPNTTPNQASQAGSLELEASHPGPSASDAATGTTPERWIELVGSDHSTQLLGIDGLVELLSPFGEGLTEVEVPRVANRLLRGANDRVEVGELHRLIVQTASALTVEDPSYGQMAARVLARIIDDEVGSLGIGSFTESIAMGHWVGIISDKVAELVAANPEVLDAAIEHERDDLFGFLGLRTVYDRYLLRHPEKRSPLETPQFFFLRVACGLSTTADEAIEFYRLISSLEYMPSSPTLFNSGTRHSQMSSCYLLDSPQDDLVSIYGRYTDIAKLSKFAGGIGLAYHRVRSRGSLIRGTNGKSNGIVPWLKTLDSSVAAVNQGGRRKGACCVYLESWHADIEEFLDLHDNTGDSAQRAHNLNLANWVPDLFMRRVERDEMWSLFDPKVVPHFIDLYGREFENAYVEAEKKGAYQRQVNARDLYARMMRTLAQTGNGWMTFKDACNLKSNQTAKPGNVIHSSNLCTEIVEITNQGETAVCNLGSINLGRFVRDGEFDFERLRARVRVAVKYLDRVIDINHYPTNEAGDSNLKWRPIGLGVMGLQDVFFQLRWPFDSERARELSSQIQEEIYYSALGTSCDLAATHGTHPSFQQTRAASGELQFDLWGVSPSQTARWDELRGRIAEHGLRNSLLLAIAPTVAISAITGCYECTEPQLSNLFERETLSGGFLQINRYLVEDLKDFGLWNDDLRAKIKAGDGSIQHIEEIPDDLKLLYRTVWEIPQLALIDMAADRSPFIDQSQSLNLFMAQPSIGKLSSMYAHAWKKGLKTTYYLRSRSTTRINKTTTAAAVSGSLKNSDSCDACQ